MTGQVGELTVIGGVWMTRIEVAEELGVSVRTVERWTREGMPAARWSSRLYRYRLPEVMAWLERRAA